MVTKHIILESRKTALDLEADLGHSCGFTTSQLHICVCKSHNLSEPWFLTYKTGIKDMPKLRVIVKIK